MEESKKLSSKKTFKKHLIACGLFAILVIVFTVLVKTVGVGEVIISEPTGEVATSTTAQIGFSAANTSIRSSIGYSETWYKISKYAGYLVFVPVFAFAALGAYQLFKRKSFKKVDRELRLLIPFYAAVGAVYLFFEKILIINYCPVLRDGVLKTSYPSSHTLFAMCFCCSAMMITASLLGKKRMKLAIVINAVLTILMAVTVVGRFLSGVHWLTDILGGVFISCLLLFLLASFLQYRPHKAKKSEE